MERPARGVKALAARQVVLRVVFRTDEAVILAAGLRGIEKGYELPPEAEDNIYEMTEYERRAAGIGSLPRNLDEALAVMEESELVAEALGEHVFEFFLRNKRQEWEQYRREVTPYERQRYLGAL